MKRLRLVIAILFFAVSCTSVHGGGVAGELSVQSRAPASAQEKAAERKPDWESRFTFEGQVRPGPYTVDPHIWVYTKEFAERFGMPKRWISSKLKGVEAAAWRKTKTGYVTCGWGGRKDACREEDAAILELYFDTRKVKLPWAPWSGDFDHIRLGPGVDSLGFLTAQHCERRRKPSRFPNLNWKDRPCDIYSISRSPFSDPTNGDEILMFIKGASYSRQGNYYLVDAYDKRAYPHLAWVQVHYTRAVGLFNPPEAALITLETRTEPLGETIRKFHEIYLPADFDRRIKAFLDRERERERTFYKKALEMK